VISAWRQVLAAGMGVILALWTLPLLVLLHLTQLTISAVSWRALFPRLPASVPRFFSLRLIREAVNSLLPVAHVGGEVVGARLLTRYGVIMPQAAASVIVDVTMEVLSQFAFLLAGIAVLALVAGAGSAWVWGGTAIAALLMAAGLVAAQRFGALRLLERIAAGISERLPLLPTASLAGINQAAEAFYRRRDNLLQSFALHLAAWVLGTLETWLVLRALGTPTPLAESFVIESLGMAARSAGFAVPGALVIQEGGIILAAAAVGVGAPAALALSLVKRVRELTVGLLGMMLWQWERRRAI
jgi:putative membrane protein